MYIGEILNMFNKVEDVEITDHDLSYSKFLPVRKMVGKVTVTEGYLEDNVLVFEYEFSTKKVLAIGTTTNQYDP